MTLQDEIEESIKNNAILFLQKAASHLIVIKDNSIISKEEAIICAVYMQMALELAIKSAILCKDDLSIILDQSKHKGDSEEKLKKKYSQNEIKVKEFDGLKNYIKKNKSKFKIDKNEISYIDKFQKYRNKVVHFDYNFSAEELTTFKKDMIFILVHIIGKLLVDEGLSPSEFFSKWFSNNEFSELISDLNYQHQMEEYVISKKLVIGKCVYCGAYTLDLDLLSCYTCLQNFESGAYGFLQCACDTEYPSIIYDRFNLINKTNGLCLACQSEVMVYKCPDCERVKCVDYGYEDDYKCDYCNSNVLFIFSVSEKENHEN